MSGWKFGARSDVGLVRDGNEDSLYAGPRLLVVADGVGGSVAGEIASKLAVQTLAPLDGDHAVTDPLAALRAAVLQADGELRDAIEHDPPLAGMGTTLTAILAVGDAVGLAQLGDSRAYLFRGGEMSQLSRDHTLVQSLVDDGEITAEQALVHPRRSWILRALDGRGEAEPDLIPLTPLPGDRYLLCSDGLSDYVEQTAIATTLGEDRDPQQTCDRLVELALQAGAPDNVTCIVAEPVDGDLPATAPVILGAATAPDPAPAPASTRADRATHAAPKPERPPGGIGRRLAIVSLIVVVLIAAAIGGTALYVRSQWYVANDNGVVGIYHGVRGDFAGISLSRLNHATDLPTDQVTEADQALLRSGQVSSGGATSEFTTLQGDACTAWTQAHPAKATTTKRPTRHRHTVARQPTPQPTLPSWCQTSQ